VLDVNIVRKSFNASDGVELEVLRDLKFSCAQDSFTSIVGPSGCGKTTTLRCILGLDTDFEGTVTPSADDVQKGGQQQKMSAVFQEPRLLPWRTVDQNVKLALANVNGQPVNDAELGSLFEELGLTAHRDFYPTELSLGLARRVALARAFAVQPSVLILDEPFVSIDDDTAARLRRLLLRVWSVRSCTALMVTHNLTEAIELSDRILFFSGSPASVVNEYNIPVSTDYRDVETVARIKAEIVNHNLQN